MSSFSGISISYTPVCPTDSLKINVNESPSVTVVSNVTVVGNVSSQDSKALFSAVESNRLDLFKIAYEGAKYSDIDIRKALKKAVARNNFEIIKMMIKPPNYRWFQFTSMLTVKYNNLSLFKSMCEMESVDMEEALKTAVYYNNLAFISYLLTLEDPSLDSGFSMAVYCNNKKLADLFYNRIGAAKLKDSQPSDISNLIDEENIEMLEYLLSKSITSHLNIMSLAESRNKPKVLKHFTVKFITDKMNELQNELNKM